MVMGVLLTDNLLFKVNTPSVNIKWIKKEGLPQQPLLLRVL